jgi:hypothetical protein
MGNMLRINIAEKQKYTVSLYDLRGAQVRMISGMGPVETMFDMRSVAKGSYTIQVKTPVEKVSRTIQTF